MTITITITIFIIVGDIIIIIIMRVVVVVIIITITTTIIIVVVIIYAYIYMLYTHMYICMYKCNRNRQLLTSKAPLKSQAQGTSLFTSAASNQRDFPKNSPWEAQVRFPEGERMRQIRGVFQRIVRGCPKVVLKVLS